MAAALLDLVLPVGHPLRATAAEAAALFQERKPRTLPGWLVSSDGPSHEQRSVGFAHSDKETASPDPTPRLMADVCMRLVHHCRVEPGSQIFFSS